MQSSAGCTALLPARPADRHYRNFASNFHVVITQPVFLTIYSSRSAPSSPNQVGMSGLMTPESLSREGSPGPEGIHLHPAPAGSNNGIVLSHGSGDHHNQVVASHLEVKTNHFPPGVNLTGAQSKFPYRKLNSSKSAIRYLGVVAL